MQHLPRELITYIGTNFLHENEGRVLLETSKLFAKVLAGHETHTFYFSHETTHDALPRLRQTVEYIRRIKTGIRKIKMVFTRICSCPKRPEITTKISSIGVLMCFHKCKLDTVRDILEWFEPGCIVDLERDICKDEGELELIDSIQRINRWVTYIEDQEHISRILAHPHICNARDFMISFNIWNTFNIDFSKVNPDNNKRLCLCLYDGDDAVCIDAYKLTDIHFELSESFYHGLKLLQSLRCDKNIQTGNARIQHVHVLIQTSSKRKLYPHQHIGMHNTMTTCI